MYADLIELVEYQAELKPNQVLLEYLTSTFLTKESITFFELNQKAKKIAFLLAEHIVPFDRVLLVYEESTDFVAALLGAIFANAIAVPVFPPTNKRMIAKLQTVLLNAKPKVILSNCDMVTKVAQLQQYDWISQLPLMQALAKGLLQPHPEGRWHINDVTWLTTDALCDLSALDYRQPRIQKTDIAYLQYTSGSTSDPKGVMISHQNILHNITLMSKMSGVENITQSFGWLPPYHDMGLICQIFFPLLMGWTSSCLKVHDFIKSPLLWLKGIHYKNAAATVAPNFAYELVAKQADKASDLSLDLSRLTHAGCAAEPIHYESIEYFCSVFEKYGFKKSAFLPAYGLAEATLFVSVTKGIEIFECDPQLLKQNILQQTSRHSYKLICVGKTYQDVMIAHPTLKQPLAENCIGEVWVCSQSVTDGYWQQEELNQSTFVVDEGSSRRYLRTGDLGFIHQGSLYITGRIKDLIIVKGHNHYPQDIEKTVSNAHTTTREGSVAAFSIMQHKTEQLVIVAEYKGGKSEESMAQTTETIYLSIIKHHQIIPYAIVLIKPRTIFKTTSGKIQRQLTKQHYENNTLCSLFQRRQVDETPINIHPIKEYEYARQIENSH